MSGPAADSVFAEAFEFAGRRHTRRESKPLTALTSGPHMEMDLPGGLGRAHLDVYTSQTTLYVRLVHFQIGETAWYDVELLPVGNPSKET